MDVVTRARTLLFVPGDRPGRFTEDVAAVRGSSCTIMLPKASADGVAAVVDVLGEQTRVLALVETAAGIVQASSICALPEVIRLAFGSIDFATEVGVAADDREALLYARSALVLASVAGGIAPPLDGVTTDLTSGEPARSDAAYASRLGFTASRVSIRLKSHRSVPRFSRLPGNSAGRDPFSRAVHAEPPRWTATWSMPQCLSG